MLCIVTPLLLVDPDMINLWLLVVTDSLTHSYLERIPITIERSRRISNRSPQIRAYSNNKITSSEVSTIEVFWAVVNEFIPQFCH